MIVEWSGGRPRVPCDVTTLRALWAAGIPREEIAERMGCSERTLTRWQTEHDLPGRPRRVHENQTTLDEAPTPEDAEASLASLDLSPWVAERARECRERHYAERRAERDDALGGLMERMG